MRVPNIYSANTGTLWRWNWVYLHGKAEDIMVNEDSAPDIFTADMPMPTVPGTYPVLIDGIPAVAVLAMHDGILSGRVALVSDTKALQHAMKPEDWR